MAVKPVVLTAVVDGTDCDICGDAADKSINGLIDICRECVIEIERQWDRGEAAAVH